MKLLGHQTYSRKWDQPAVRTTAIPTLLHKGLGSSGQHKPVLEQRVSDQRYVLDENMDHLRLQSDLDLLVEWTKHWQLRFNVDKCKVIHLGTSNWKSQYHMTHSSTGDIDILKETTEENE